MMSRQTIYTIKFIAVVLGIPTIVYIFVTTPLATMALGVVGAVASTLILIGIIAIVLMARHYANQHADSVAIQQIVAEINYNGKICIILMAIILGCCIAMTLGAIESVGYWLSSRLITAIDPSMSINCSFLEIIFTADA